MFLKNFLSKKRLLEAEAFALGLLRFFQIFMVGILALKICDILAAFPENAAGFVLFQKNRGALHIDFHCILVHPSFAGALGRRCPELRCSIKLFESPVFLRPWSPASRSRQPGTIRRQVCCFAAAKICGGRSAEQKGAQQARGSHSSALAGFCYRFSFFSASMGLSFLILRME